jgi:hypothetical protein
MDPNVALYNLREFFAGLAEYGNGGERPKGARRLAREAVTHAEALDAHMSNGGQWPDGRN